VEKDWKPEADSSVKVIARLRNKAPLAIERKYGEGRVVAMLTKASPQVTSLGAWNNWGRENPSYVVALLEMQSYLSASRHPDDLRLVGTPLGVPIDSIRYSPQVRFTMPREAGGAVVNVDAAATDEGHEAVLADTDSSGIYEAQLSGTDGSQHVERFAYNVVAEEGDLRKVDSTRLVAALDGVHFDFHQAGEINYNPQQLAGFNLSESMLYLLVAILIGEQFLAYACSYHPATKEGAR
jgi:hypothetical protein